jgi:hypothetical protein
VAGEGIGFEFTIGEQVELSDAHDQPKALGTLRTDHFGVFPVKEAALKCFETGLDPKAESVGVQPGLFNV